MVYAKTELKNQVVSTCKSIESSSPPVSETSGNTGNSKKLSDSNKENLLQQFKDLLKNLPATLEDTKLRNQAVQKFSQLFIELYFLDN